MTRLTHTEGYDTWPAWSPDGRHIALINGRGSHIGPIRIIPADGGEAVLLARQTIAKHKLAFAPDGGKLLGLFHKQGRYALRWFTIDTGALSESLFADSWGLRYALSNDGQSIAVVTTHDVVGEQGGNNGPQCDLWVMPADGGEPKKLVEFPGRVYDVAWGLTAIR